MSDKAATIRIAGIVRESIVDGPGIRFVVFAQGCPHQCSGCHNPQTHDFQGGYECSIDTILAEIDKNPLLSGVTFSGGEPFCQAEAFLALAKQIKNRELNLVAYSGYTLEQLQGKAAVDEHLFQLLSLLDVLIDGPFVLEEKDLTLPFRGSKNQRYIEM